MKEHIKILDFLRGIAALGVVLFHFGAGAIPTIAHNYLSEIFSYGEYGVQVFFVISGFIIPFSLYKANYTINNFFRNIARRFIRIDPPSYLSMLFTMALYYSAMLYLGRPIAGIEGWPGLSFFSIFSNLTYTAIYTGTNWYNPVFWTLAIEFQFYLLIGLLLPVLLRKNKLMIVLLFLFFLASSFIKVQTIFYQSSFFVLGMVLFLSREKLLDKTTSNILLLVAFISCFAVHGSIELISAVFAVAFISFFNFSNPVTNHLGKISYSLYLTHLFAGTGSEMILKRILPGQYSESMKLIMFLVYVLISIGFATIFYHVVEKYFLRLSKKIVFR